MNIITNILFSIYLYFLFEIENSHLYIIVLGIAFPYFEIIFSLFIKNKLKINNKIFHSIFTLAIINLVISMPITTILNFSFLNVFTFLFLGNIIHLLSDLFKNKLVYLLYPIKNTGFNISISNYFDIYPVIILIVSNFLIIFLEFKITIFERFIPMIFLVLYFLTRFTIKKIISRIIFKDLEAKYKVFIAPTLRITVWNIIRVSENNVYLFQLDIIKRKYLFVKYFSNNILEAEKNSIEKSSLFLDFKNIHNYLYYQVYEHKNNIKFVRVFDIRNFFNLFKREQRYYEAKFIKNDLIKEKLIL